MRISTIDHTADVGIEVEGKQLAEVFEGAALGMFNLICGPDCEVVPRQAMDVSLSSEDILGLMFEWLNELIYIQDSEGLLLSDFEVHEIESNGLRATVKGERYDENRHCMETEVKAATYHQMVVEQRGDHWFARVIFDV